MILHKFPYLIFLWGMMVVSLGFSQVHDDQKSIEELLVFAEGLRKSNVDQFNALLIDLDSSESEMTFYESCLFRYLKIYSEAFKGDYNSSSRALEELIEECNDKNIYIRAHSLLANLQVIKGDFESAVSNLNRSIQLVETIDNHFLKTQTYNVASMIYRLINQDDLSLKYAELLLANPANESDTCYGNFNRFRIYMRQGDGEQFTDEIFSAINQCSETENLIPALFLKFDFIRYTVNEMSSELQVSNALNELVQLEDSVEKTQFKNLKVYYNSLKSKIFYLSGLLEDAEKYALLTIDQNASIGETEQLLVVHDVLMSIYVKRNDMQSAYAALKAKADIEQSLYNEKLAKQVAYYRAIHENLVQELEIERLNQSNDLLALENQLAAETTKKQQLMMLLILTLLLFLGAWSYKIKRKHDYFKEVAEIDHLTQVYTRKAFEERMRDLLDNNSAKHEPVNLAIMDLDHFKYVNDEHGHLVGDWVLKQAILTCEDVADQDIMIARLGGEEFAIVSPGIEPCQMIDLMNKMRVAIEMMDCAESGAELTVTASFGVSHSGLSGYNISMLLTHADLALFEAKNNGRNRVVSYQSVMAKTPVAKIS
ncbi:GGDEF domain-containing protein [Marinicella sediminis]|uniref:diguanylate cyclase n=2 Tax=Marinicella sediminis TaxID=1792834 RepID=A0ABV7JAN5_9GAMM